MLERDHTYIQTLKHFHPHTHIHIHAHEKVGKTMLSQSLFGRVVLAENVNTGPVPSLPNTMDRKPLYFSGNG